MEIESREAQLLYETSALLIASTTPAEVLEALSIVSPPGSNAHLFTMDPSDKGEPEWMTIAATASHSGKSLSPAATRVHLNSFPVTKLFMATPDAPLMVENLDTDPRLDEPSRKLCAKAGFQAFVVLPFALQGRWIGMCSIVWATPQVFTETHRRLYQGLLKQTALTMDRRLLQQQTQDALQENKRQRMALQAIIESLPAGLYVSDAKTGKPQLYNSTAVDILGRSIAPEIGPEGFAATYNLCHPESINPMADSDLPIAQALKGQRAQLDLDVVRPGGSRVSVEATAVPIRDETGTVTGVVMSLMNISDRKRAEQERLRIQLQDELIRTQAAALAERSTPLIPISDSIMVMPLIGSIDSDRASQMIGALLDGVQRARVRFAILDITGVRNIDTQAANALINAAKAVSLLGVEPILTGIRAEVAQTLVALGMSLNEIVTRSTLQSGIAYASQRHKSGAR